MMLHTWKGPSTVSHPQISRQNPVSRATMLLTEASDSGSLRRAPGQETPQTIKPGSYSRPVRSRVNNCKGTFQRRTEQASSFLDMGILSKWRPQKLPLFPKFTKLPKELQIKIWEFATLLPRLIKVKAPADLPGIRSILKVANTNGHHPLLLACVLSRQVILMITSKHYSAGFYRAQHHLPLHPAYWIYFNPDTDTIRVPDILTLVSLGSWYNFCPNDQPNPRARVTAVKSLAISSVVLPVNTPSISDSDLSTLQWTGAGPSFLTSIMRYTGLEELIFVEPTLEGGIFRKRSAVAKSSYKQRLEESLKYISWVLKANIQGVVHRNQSVDQQLFGTRVPIVLSEWWANPRITVMSEEEVKARFGKAKVVGKGNFTFKWTH